ncbi:MAG: prephenate dehydratase [Longispora sp.]|nr:prephenate dehydratase [Longispora sp. (in: high G+C Gram-positive bacteria)]
MKYAYLGPAGTFCEAALRTFAAPEDELMSARNVPEALDDVRSGTADAALVPLENSVGGGVSVTLDELVTANHASTGAPDPPLIIIREVLLQVSFDFIGRIDADRVAAHPQASAQCREWLRRHIPDALVVDVLSNAAAALAVADGTMPAAITAPLATVEHGLKPLHSDIGDRPATTRFVLIAPREKIVSPTGRDLTTFAVYIQHDHVGALAKVLGELAGWGVNLTRIESRPTGESLGRYVFFLDCEGHVDIPPLSKAIEKLNEFCVAKFLGSYPSAGR